MSITQPINEPLGVESQHSFITSGVRAAQRSRMQWEELLHHQQLQVWGPELVQCLVGGKLSSTPTRERIKRDLAKKVANSAPRAVSSSFTFLTSGTTSESPAPKPLTLSTTSCGGSEKVAVYTRAMEVLQRGCFLLSQWGHHGPPTSHLSGNLQNHPQSPRRWGCR